MIVNQRFSGRIAGISASTAPDALTGRWERARWMKPRQPPYVITVEAQGYNDDTTGLIMLCSCGQEGSMIRPDGRTAMEAPLADLNRIAAEHSATHASPRL